MTSKKVIAEWFDQGKKDGARFMIVVCDTFSYEDYPAFVGPTEDIIEKINYFRRSPMQRIMEVYDLEMSRGDQLKAPRVFNYPKPKVEHDSNTGRSSTSD